MNEMTSFSKRGAMLTKIQDKNQRNVTFCKRKRGFLKKAIEMSVLCGQDMFIVLFDREKQKLYEFNSTEEFDCRVVTKLLNNDVKIQFQYERYTNSDYTMFVNDKGDKSDFGSMFDPDEHTLDNHRQTRKSKDHHSQKFSQNI